MIILSDFDIASAAFVSISKTISKTIKIKLPYADYFPKINFKFNFIFEWTPFLLTHDSSQRLTASVVVDNERVLTFDTFFNPFKEVNQLS